MNILKQTKEYLTQDQKREGKILTFIPILHNKDKIFLQLCGWSINLYSDGTYDIEVTEGG